MKRFILILLTISLHVLPVSAQRVWEELETREQVLEHAGESDFLDVSTKDGYIYITSSRAVTVKIFSILGQLISQKEIQPGSHRVRITARGIYILKIGSLTKRITI